MAYQMGKNYPKGKEYPESVGFPGGSDGKESARNVGDPSLHPGSARSPGAFSR